MVKKTTTTKTKASESKGGIPQQISELKQLAQKLGALSDSFKELASEFTTKVAALSPEAAEEVVTPPAKTPKTTAAKAKATTAKSKTTTKAAAKTTTAKKTPAPAKTTKAATPKKTTAKAKTTTTGTKATATKTKSAGKTVGKSKASPATSSPGSSSEAVDDYDSMSLRRLKAVAKQRKLPRYARMKRPEILDALRKADTAS